MLKNGESKREMKKNKVKQYLVFCLNFICLALYSQPSIDWTSITWLNKDFPTDNIVNIQKESSDYDWWYDHCNAYANLASKTGHYGYVTCGVANFRLKEDLGSSTENPLFIPQQYDERNFTPKGCSFLLRLSIMEEIVTGTMKMRKTLYLIIVDWDLIQLG